MQQEQLRIPPAACRLVSYHEWGVSTALWRHGGQVDGIMDVGDGTWEGTSVATIYTGIIKTPLFPPINC
jgi:hypothetical protein